jgi:hypothetical protein
LWQDQKPVATAVTGSSSTPPSITGTQAAEFQIALWDIIYNCNGNGAFGPSLQFSGDTGIISAAHGWADTAAVVDTRDNSSYKGVGVLVASDGRQNQSMFLGEIHTNSINISVVPLPPSILLGLVLLAAVAIVTWWWCIREIRENSVSF